MRVWAVSAGARARERTVSGLARAIRGVMSPRGRGSVSRALHARPCRSSKPLAAAPIWGGAWTASESGGGKQGRAMHTRRGGARVALRSGGGERAPARPHLSPMRVPTDAPPPPVRTPKTRPAGAPGLSLTRQGRASVRARACAPSLPGARHLLCSRPRLLSLSLAARTFSRRWTRPTGNCRPALADLETAFLEGPPLPAPRVPCACRKKRSGGGE